MSSLWLRADIAGQLGVATYQVVEAADSAYTLVDRGGVVATLLIGLIFLWTAIQFRWIVPGWVYTQQEKRLEGLEELTKGFVDSIKGLTEELREQRLMDTRTSTGTRRSR